jgi:hypothetical protein
MSAIKLHTLQSPGALIEDAGNRWRLQLPASNKKQYQVAQLYDYQGLARSNFPHRPPTQFSLKARVSHKNLPGTWGFGFWNDPFGLSLGFGANRWRLPTLPNAAWFFFASKENHLSFHDQLAGSGQLAAVFNSPHPLVFTWLLAALTTPLLAFNTGSRWLRTRAARLVAEETVKLQLDPTEWHEYGLEWGSNSVLFRIDETLVLQTKISPQPPQGFVLWIDNQFAAWRPDGSFGYGVLPSQECWLEIQDLRLN